MHILRALKSSHSNWLKLRHKKTWRTLGGFARDVDVDEKWIHFVDENVKAKFPLGTEIESIRPYGASYWTRTAEISTRMANGTPRSYFLKVSQSNNGKGMILGGSRRFYGQQVLYSRCCELTGR
ncbi:hypothetical protein BDZ45DRAFT_724247 [Acephala macrosclerotiorum]|nr:hypothetical protein BDZ45DRAFT_724247 [Acephala macrosclerotiorum]